MPREKMSLNNLMGGAAAERFDFELSKVLKNIADPLTKATAKRALTMTITICPSKSRSFSTFSVNVGSKLAPMTQVESEFVMEENGEGGFIANELHMGQMPGQETFDDIKVMVSQVVEEIKEDTKRELRAATNVRNIKSAKEAQA